MLVNDVKTSLNGREIVEHSGIFVRESLGDGLGRDRRKKTPE